MEGVRGVLRLASGSNGADLRRRFGRVKLEEANIIIFLIIIICLLFSFLFQVDLQLTGNGDWKSKNEDLGAPILQF